jgi:hypothetical protein
MFTTAGAARATASAKLCMPTERAGAGAASCTGALTAPSNAGFHHTTKKAAARPTTTARSKKLARTRVLCKSTPHAWLRTTD